MKSIQTDLTKRVQTETNGMKIAALFFKETKLHHAVRDAAHHLAQSGQRTSLTTHYERWQYNRQKIQLISCVIYFAQVREHVKLKRKKKRQKFKYCVSFERKFENIKGIF